MLSSAAILPIALLICSDRATAADAEGRIPWCRTGFSEDVYAVFVSRGISEGQSFLQELLDRVNEKLKVRQQLAVEPHQAKGISDSYTEDKAGLEMQIWEKTEMQHQIPQELQHTSSCPHVLEEEWQQLHQLRQERELITRQQLAMKENTGSWNCKSSHVPIMVVTQEVMTLISGQEGQVNDWSCLTISLRASSVVEYWIRRMKSVY
ncbi:hypothetical protein scyTo_0005547 [Scyliorhinus torazame]|uniref:Uncharacterized protein n=1 Tax=Scyliorhinus torazame TaxID=75743 RepID=A0A401P9L3_SCYTO|nr:hypothetical protein [Scyliorhinus torazame]